VTISTSAAPATGLSLENARILIVDDEDANLMVLRRMLERAGYTNLQTINDSSLAVERFVSFEPDLLVLDLHMPMPDGFEVMAQIEPLVAPDSYVPILVLTADITESTRERALAVGARDFLTKPFRYTELLLRINNLLETRALHTQLHRDKSILEARMREQQATDQARAERRRSASRRIEAVLASDRNGPTSDSGIGLQIVFQPILDLTTGEVLGAEALSRFGTEPQRSPAQWFIEAAEVGLGIQLELAALRRAAEGLSMLPPNAFLSVNASSETIRSPALLNALEGLPGSRLVIELTEHERMEDYETLVAPVAKLRERGIRLAVDDAGAGFASLQHIRHHQARPHVHRRAGRGPRASRAHHGPRHLRPRHRRHPRRRGHRHRAGAGGAATDRRPPRPGSLPRRTGHPSLRHRPLRPPGPSGDRPLGARLTPAGETWGPCALAEA
jgi:EAL domain-containing protein (putative c-di-GMP-specific phosphodiesterase class I)